MTAAGQNSEVPTSDSVSATSERETAPEPAGFRNSELAIRARIEGWWAAGRGYWTPPSWMTDRLPSYAELWAYAWEGGWTRRTRGPIRWLGIWWLRLVALPVSWFCRGAEWVAQRPGRTLAALILWQAVVRSTPGAWLADHIIRPVLAVLAWVFLP